MTSLVAVIDQGSTSTKGAVVSPQGEVLEAIATPVERHHQGPRVTHDPEALAKGVETTLRELLHRHEVAGIGLACQRSTCLLWDRATGEPRTEALSWQDRTQDERVAALAVHGDEVRRLTGLHLSPYYAAPKLAALLEGVPNGLERAASGELVAGTLDAFLVHRLTGRPATEPGTAGRTLLYDLEADAWSERLCGIFGVPPASLPELGSSAGDWGTFEDVPLVAVAGDQQASLLGHGGWREGTIAAHFGTGAFVLASTGESPVRHEGLLTAVLASTPESRRFQIEGSVNSAGSAVDWARSLTGIDLDDWTDRPLGEGPPWFLPAFSGLGAPWWESQANAACSGLVPSTGPDELFSAVLSGVAHRVLDCVEAIASAGVSIEALRVSGKLTRLSGLVQLLADAGGLPVEVSAEEETGTLGLARLALCRQGGEDATLGRPVHTAATIDPAWSADRALGQRSLWSAFVRGQLAALLAE